MRDGLEFLISSLLAWVHWLLKQEWDFRGGGVRGFETFSSTQKHLGKGERKGRIYKIKKKSNLNAELFSKGGFFFLI